MPVAVIVPFCPSSIRGDLIRWSSKRISASMCRKYCPITYVHAILARHSIVPMTKDSDSEFQKSGLPVRCKELIAFDLSWFSSLITDNKDEPGLAFHCSDTRLVDISCLSR
jgi:hypothetical protein